ncbi:hypothetical protein TIFTF001_004899 [Ficus carica]|uniref:Uncharacterized protein n=1 Tax=Ficus carica TaxID=3494 RepID=A0AA87ZHK3_FICCA|nr:hypothetical protein TIFTF001_004899 [Ficus carica]
MASLTISVLSKLLVNTNFKELGGAGEGQNGKMGVKSRVGVFGVMSKQRKVILFVEKEMGKLRGSFS